MSERTLRTKWVGWILIIFSIVVVYFIFVLIHHPQQAQHISKKPPIVAVRQAPWFVDPSLPWQKIKIRKGDSLYLIFKHYHVHYAILKKILAIPEAKKYLSQLHIGQSLFLFWEASNKRIALKYSIDNVHTFYLYSDNGKFKTHLVNKPLSKSRRYKSATIKKSFVYSARRAGLTYAQIDQFSNIFSGTINFSRDIHRGDKFSVLYNEYHWHNKKEKLGNILAATLTHQGKTYIAVRFTYPRNHSGYYKPDGHSVEPLFLKRPLKYKRISGFFTLHRYDPVLHIVHPHLGVDFAAPRGTKIKSIGNGKIIFRGKKGGYGNAVIIRYSSKYKALYGHLSRFAKKQPIGSIVKKGEVIGYVGSTGWATGPHLHFEIYVYGIPRNPLKMKFIGGKSIPKAYLKAFHQNAGAMLAELKMYQGQEFAMADPKGNNEKR